MEENFKAAELKIGINNFKVVKDGTMIVTCQSKQEVETFERAVSQKMEKSYNIEVTRLRRPRIKITNITEEYSMEELEELIQQQNPINGEIKVKFIKK